MGFKISSFNVRGLNSPQKRSMLWKEARLLQSDILCLQETHFSASKPPKFSHQNFPTIICSNAPKKKRGVAILIKDTISFRQIYKDVDVMGRYIILVGEVNNTIYTIVNVYLPNVKQISLLNRIWKRVREVREGYTIICGDFNAIPNKTLDVSAETPKSRERVTLSRFMASESLHDVWRCQHSTERDYSYFSSVHRTYSRIDFFLVDKFLLQNISMSSVHNITWSDHAPVSIMVEGSRTETRANRWRNDTFLFSHPDHKHTINKELHEFFKNNTGSVPDPFTVWNCHKAYIRGILMKMSSVAKKQRNKKLNDLLLQIKNLESINKKAPDPKTSSQLDQLRHDLRILLISQHKHIVKKWKANYYSQGNKAGKLLANQVKEKTIKQKIPFIFHPNTGIRLSNPKDIANAFRDYYNNLYNLKDDTTNHQPSPEMIQKFLDSISLPKLNLDQLQYINAPISMSELNKTILSLPNNKSPGPDGFSAEYYRTFHSILGPHLINIYATAISTSSFPPEMLTATIVTLPKPGKSLDTPQNFRPISLLNVDLKIYAKIIANRLAQFLPTLVKHDQVGFIPGRQAPDATRRIINLLHAAESSGTPSLLLSLDAEKAFDRIHWGYLRLVLDKFGFSGEINSAILALYTNPSAMVYTEGMFSDSFNITNGTRQGCPLSPLIFALLMEPLAEKIRSHPEISGIKISKEAHTISLFADDVILSLSNPSTSLQTVHNILNHFNQISYYKVNASKSNLLAMNIEEKLRNSLSSRFPYPWADKPIQYLGIQLTTPSSNLFKVNLAPFISSIQPELNRLKSFCLSWMGRLAAYKMLILPRILYYFRALPISIPAKFFTTAQSQLHKFVWADKKPRCSRSSLSKHKKAGGMGLPILRDYFAASILDQTKYWFQTQSSKHWATIEQAWMNPNSLRSTLLAYSFSNTCLKSNYPTIQLVLNTWKKFCSEVRHNTDLTEIPTPLNSLCTHITDLNTKQWEHKGITLISDMYDREKLIPFNTLAQKYSLPTSDYYMYIRITTFLKSHQMQPIKIPHKAWAYWNDKSIPRKGISLFYTLIQQKESYIKLPAHQKWESELSMSFSEKQWLEAIKSNNSFTRSTAYWETTQKLLLRWYYTPYLTAKFSNIGSNECWRGCGRVGTLLHMIWECPNLRSFWRAIFKLISKITGFIRKGEAELAILSIHIDQYPPALRPIVIQILMAARLTITSKWKSNSSPNISDVTRKIDEAFKYEQIMANTQGNTNRFYKQWDPWISFRKIT